MYVRDEIREYPCYRAGLYDKERASGSPFCLRGLSASLLYLRAKWTSGI